MSALPATMTCVEIKKPGGPEALVPTTRPVPQPKGRRDPDQGPRPPASTAPTSPSAPVSIRTPPGAFGPAGPRGRRPVASLGAGVTGWKVGDAICALTPVGAYAEYCTAPAPQCLPLPKGFDMVRAAALRRTTSHRLAQPFRARPAQIRRERADPWRRERHRTTAIQLAKAFGATVFTTVRNEGQGQGGARTRRRPRHPLQGTMTGAAEVKKLSGGVDVVLDMVAGDYLPKNLQLLKQDGRCVVIAVQLGAVATISAAVVMVNRLTLTGSTLRPQSVESKGRMAPRPQGKRSGRCSKRARSSPSSTRPSRSRTTAGAHAELERADHVGKVMLTV